MIKQAVFIPLFLIFSLIGICSCGLFKQHRAYIIYESESREERPEPVPHSDNRIAYQPAFMRDSVVNDDTAIRVVCYNVTGNRVGWWDENVAPEEANHCRILLQIKKHIEGDRYLFIDSAATIGTYTQIAPFCWRKLDFTTGRSSYFSVDTSLLLRKTGHALSVDPITGDSTITHIFYYPLVNLKR